MTTKRFQFSLLQLLIVVSVVIVCVVGGLVVYDSYGRLKFQGEVVQRVTIRYPNPDSLGGMVFNDPSNEKAIREFLKYLSSQKSELTNKTRPNNIFAHIDILFEDGRIWQLIFTKVNDDTKGSCYFMPIRPGTIESIVFEVDIAKVKNLLAVYGI